MFGYFICNGIKINLNYYNIILNKNKVGRFVLTSNYSLGPEFKSRKIWA